MCRNWFKFIPIWCFAKQIWFRLNFHCRCSTLLDFFIVQIFSLQFSMLYITRMTMCLLVHRLAVEKRYVQSLLYSGHWHKTRTVDVSTSLLRTRLQNRYGHHVWSIISAWGMDIMYDLLSLPEVWASCMIYYLCLRYGHHVWSIISASGMDIMYDLLSLPGNLVDFRYISLF